MYFGNFVKNVIPNAEICILGVNIFFCIEIKPDKTHVQKGNVALTGVGTPYYH